MTGEVVVQELIECSAARLFDSTIGFSLLQP